MKITMRNVEPTKKVLTITVDQEELEPYMDKARKEIANQVNIPGFRKGHVPGKLIEQRFGFGAVIGEAVNDAVPDFYNKAIEERKLRPMDQPKIDVKDVPESHEDDKKLKLTAEVEVRPEVKLPKFDAMEVSIPEQAVTDEDVDKRLNNLRQRFGTLVSVDRPAKKGDFASINLDAQIDGKSVDSQEGISYEVGSGAMLSGLDEALDGLSAGEDTTFSSTLEGGEHEGEKAEVKLTLNSVKEERLPELDDEFAKDASEFDTLDELKADIRKQSEVDAQARQATEARDAFMAQIEEAEEIPVPKGVLERTVTEHLRSMGVEDPKKATKEQEKEAKDSAEKELRDQIVLDTVAESLNVQVTQADVTNFLASIAQQYGMDPTNFITSIVQNGQLNSAVQEVARSKGMIEAMRQVTFKDPAGKVVDLGQFLGSDEEEEEASVAAASQAAAVADEVSKSEE